MIAPPPSPGRWERWKRTEPARLACYVDSTEIARRYEEPGPWPTYLQRSADPRGAVRMVYEGLAAQGLRYETAAIDFTGFQSAEQLIRPPGEVSARGGNCLELTLLFTGLCLAHKLRALVVLLEDHALAAVWLGGDLDDFWSSGLPGPRDHLIMSQGLLGARADEASVREALDGFVADGTYLLVECTGVTEAGEPGTPSLRLAFEEAVAEGAARTARGRVTDIVDIAFHQRDGLYRPYALPGPTALADPAPADAPRRAADGVDRAGPPDRAAPPWSRPGAPGARYLAGALRRAAATEPALAVHLDRPSWTREDLARLLTDLAPAPAGPEGIRLRDVARGLALAMDAHAFIAAWMPQAADPAALRRVLLDCVADSARVRPHGLAEHLDAVALYRPAADPDSRRALLRFVVHLAVAAGVDTADPAFHDWCRAGGYDIAEADRLRQRFRRRAEDARRRLVVHLRGAPAQEWPDTAEAWLLDERGRPTDELPVMPCEPSAAGVAETLCKVLEWAEDLPGLTYLHRVDIALPTRTLLRWRAEEADVGTRLGAHHQVVLHWGERLHPPQHLRRLARQAGYRLRHVEEEGDEVYGAIDWVDPGAADARDDFEERLRKNEYPGALGLRFVPDGRESLFEALVAQFPILLWPDRTVSEWTAVEEEVRDRWVTLPGGFTDAYRAAWTRADDAPPPLAGLRAVWDDRPWLDFCRTTGTHTAGIGTAARGTRTRGRR
ncbi:hypothetical protein ACFVZ4_03585 [Streptomyces goshikiensis]|uniref:vWA-MoxR associated conflict system protein n=1 Tax=Streptomyces goshikiensis TaxID=1942 RepID=UPI003689BD64